MDQQPYLVNISYSDLKDGITLNPADNVRDELWFKLL